MRKIEAFNEDYNHEPVKVMHGVEIWENDYDYDDGAVTAWVELTRDGLPDDLFVGYKLEDAPEYVDIDWETRDNPPTIRGVYIMVKSKDLDDLIYDDFNGATQITNDEDASKYLGVSLDEYKEIIEEVKKVALDEMESWAEHYAEHGAEYEEPDYDPYDDYDPFMYEELDEGANEGFTCRKIKKPKVEEDMEEQRYFAKEVDGKGYIFDKKFSETAPIAVEKTIEFAQQQVDKFNKEDNMNENKQLTEAVDRNKLADFIKKAVEDLKVSDAYSEIAPTRFFDMGAPNGLHLVIGYDNADNYDAEDLEHLALDKSGKYVVCAKLAVNVDDLQSDFDWDWYMPYNKETGDVWDTEMSVAKEDDYDVLAQDFIDEFNKMKDLEIDEDGAIIKHEEVVEEAKKDCDDKDDKCESCDDKKSLKESIDIDMEALEAYANMEEGETITVTGDLLNVLNQCLDALKGKVNECKDKKPLKEDMSTVQDTVYDYLAADGGYVDDEMFDLFCDLVERVDDYNDEDDIRSAIDDGMIYDNDQWTAYRYYCNIGDPEDQMWEGLTNDVINICSRLAGNNNDDIEVEGEVVKEAVDDTVKIKDVLGVELQDDDTETGGVSFAGEKVKDIVDEFELDIEAPIDELNGVLREIGIRPIKK